MAATIVVVGILLIVFVEYAVCMSAGRYDRMVDRELWEKSVADEIRRREEERRRCSGSSTCSQE